MTKIQPLGSKLLVLPITEKENHITDGGIELMEIELSKATVVEVGSDVIDVFKKGDVVIFPKTRGVSKPYKGQTHLFIDGLPPNQGGDCWGIEVTEIVPKDKGDGL